MRGRSAPAAALTPTDGGQHRDQDPEVLRRWRAVDDPDDRSVRGGRRVGGCVAAHSGMFPCFLGGRLSRLVFNARSARVTFIRVLLGVMTVSM